MPTRSPELLAEPHRRYNPLADEWVLVSTGRTQRPWLGRRELEREEAPAYDPECYLCPGNARAGGARNPRYDATFVFTNDFAALRPDVEASSSSNGLLRAGVEPGTCRVICFSPRHDQDLGRLGAGELRGVVEAWADQSAELGAAFSWVQVFENRGEAMGASNPHPHGQVWATRSLPNVASRELRTQEDHARGSGSRLLLDYAAQELAAGDRVVDADDEWLVVVPFWATWPFETMLLPRRPAGRLPDLDDAQRASLAGAVGRLVRRYDGLFDQPFPYSMGWHQAPFDGGAHLEWQLHAHAYPPLLRAGVRKFMVGYELLAEPQRDISAEEAANRLRAVEAATPARAR